MGVDFDDYDNDGWPDIFVNALANQRYALFHNVKGSFEYVSNRTGVGAASLLHSGWGAKFFDYDNDGWKDLFVGQGHVMDNIQLTQPNLRYLEPPLLLRNVNGKFSNVSAKSGAPFQQPRTTRGVAFGDLDNDGFIDIVMNCNDEPAVILRNQGGNGNHWLAVNTVGTKSNRDGIGARIKLTLPDGTSQYGFVSTASSYLSASDKRVHFGLGAQKTCGIARNHVAEREDAAAGECEGGPGGDGEGAVIGWRIRSMNGVDLWLGRKFSTMPS